jgi:F0F1-type ATP synthase assembly protein I
MRKSVRLGSSLVAGVLVGVVIHYLLYRLSLPTQPFIYVNF